MKYTLCFLVLIVTIVIHLFSGETSISFAEYFNAIFQYNPENIKHVIAIDFRIPRILIAIIAGSGLSIAGLFLQTLFKNPLAEPNILGISTGSSLFVALSIMSGVTIFQTDWGIITSALLGALTIALILLFCINFVRSHNSILIIGIMIMSFTGAIIGILQTNSEANQLKQFTMWGLGSLQQVSMTQIPIILIVFFTCIIFSFFLIKNLNALVLGNENAMNLGINSKKSTILLIIITSVLTGLITAFCGPIAFVGMAVPNLVKLVFKTQNHFQLIIGSLFFGAIFMVVCDILVQLFATMHFSFPINAMTALIGAPIAFYFIVKRWA